MSVSALVEEVQAHLQEVHDDPSKGLNDKLLDSIDRQVSATEELQEAIQEQERDALLNRLSALLPTLQQDPTPATSLIQILISSSHSYDFSRVLSIHPSVDFLAGLKSSIAPINLITLSLLEKAKYHTSDIGIVAGKPEIVSAIIHLWLCTSDTAVATRAHDVLLALLSADAKTFTQVNGLTLVDDGLLWRRIFRDEDVYSSIFSICSLSTAGQEGQPSKRDKTVAQARLLDMLLCIDSEPVRTSQFRDVEERYRVKEGGGLLHFAAVDMVDYQDDVLMHMTLMDFYSKYLGTKHAVLPNFRQNSPDSEQNSSYALHFLCKNGIHKRTMSYYLNPSAHSSLDLTYLYGSAANYLATYCSTYPQDVLRHQDVVDSILGRLNNVLQTVSPGQWAQGQTPKHDLHVLASIPRAALIPRTGNSPLFFIPAKSASPDTFKTLAHIFHGDTGTIAPEHLTSKEEDNAASARAMYFLYVEHYPNFWAQIVASADIVAVKDVALAAISLIGAVICAQWTPLPDRESSELSPFALPTEKFLTEKCQTSGVRLPQSGIEAIMSEPAIGIVVPYLMKPAQTFSNLVGGGRGDVESAVYRVAVAKHDVLILLHQKLKEWVGTHSDAQDMVATVARRVAQGSMGGTSEVGGRVGTLEL